ncbi:MAG TPA: hypothetical protein VMZ71_09960 [Gemmataceae bacterium]|nr:hypothetical protein [Gemmataceae bacterium]
MATPTQYRRVCDMLSDLWDPIGVKVFGPPGEYDHYAAGLIRLVESGADEYKVSERLRTIARTTMGISAVDAERDKFVAKLLIEIVRSAE